jgi:hypothetical protein
VPVSNFDLVAPPRHDHLKGDNVVETRGSTHRVTPRRLVAGANKIRDDLAHLPRPLVTVLIGGNNKCYTITPTTIQKLADQLRNLTQEHGVGLAVTTSRRTGEENERMLREALTDVPAVIWDGKGDNPYFGYLGLADAFIVTSDSVNMLSEAASTGKPIHVVDLEGGNRKFRNFHSMMRSDGIMRPFEGKLEHWDYDPVNDTENVAMEVRRRIELHN